MDLFYSKGAMAKALDVRTAVDGQFAEYALGRLGKYAGRPQAGSHGPQNEIRSSLVNFGGMVAPGSTVSW